jgi:dihydrofolate reductase
MGRKTFESMPKALPNRTNIVLTNKRDYQPDGATVVHSIEDALALVKEDPQPFIIGGGEIYRLFMPYCDRIELTRVHHNFEADVFFPEIDLNQWKEIAREDINASEEQAYNYSYITYEKKYACKFIYFQDKALNFQVWGKSFMRHQMLPKNVLNKRTKS